MSPSYLIGGIAIMIAVNLVLRFLPFVLFRKRVTPPWVNRLGRTLPAVMMTLLSIYCLKGVQFTTYPYGLSELITVAVVILLHLWRRNTLLSIFGGTALYMLLLNVVFAV